MKMQVWKLTVWEKLIKVFSKSDAQQESKIISLKDTAKNCCKSTTDYK